LKTGLFEHKLNVKPSSATITYFEEDPNL